MNRVAESRRILDRLYGSDREIESLLLAVREHMSGVDAVDDLVGECLFFQSRARDKEIFQNQLTERDGVRITARVIAVDPAIDRVIVLVGSQPCRELLRCAHSMPSVACLAAA